MEVIDGGYGGIVKRNMDENITHRIHGAAISGNMDPINISPLC